MPVSRKVNFKRVVKGIDPSIFAWICEAPLRPNGVAILAPEGRAKGQPHRQRSLAEKRAALDAWAKHIGEIVIPPAGLSANTKGLAPAGLPVGSDGMAQTAGVA